MKLSDTVRALMMTKNIDMSKADGWISEIDPAITLDSYIPSNNRN